MRLAIWSGKEHAPLLTSGLRDKIHRTISTLLIPTHFWRRLYPSSLWTSKMFSFCNGKDEILLYVTHTFHHTQKFVLLLTTFSKKTGCPYMLREYFGLYKQSTLLHTCERLFPKNTFLNYVPMDVKQYEDNCITITWETNEHYFKLPYDAWM